MKKIKTLFKKDPNNLGRVVDEIDPENKWVLTKDCLPTRKFDGTSMAIINEKLYKRFDLKPGRNLPEGAISCQDPDGITGRQPYWVPCIRKDKSNRWAYEAFEGLCEKVDGTYELCGPKVNGNHEKFIGHVLVPHGRDKLFISDFSFDGLRRYLSDSNVDIEGIVFHNMKDGRMCKLRKKDFGVKRHLRH